MATATAGRLRVRGADVADEAFVRCRTYNHAWDEFNPIDLEAPWYGWRLSLRCLRCSTERHDNIDFKGQLMGRRYVYPDGYQTRGEDRPTKVTFREELFVRLRKQLEKNNAVGGEAPKEAEVTPISKARTARQSVATVGSSRTRKKA